MKKLEKKNVGERKSEKGALKMSQIINDLKGKKCNMVLRDSIDSLFDNKLACTVLETDEEWIKVAASRRIRKKERPPRQ